MKNPHQVQQQALLNRISSSMDRLQGVMDKISEQCKTQEGKDIVRVSHTMKLAKSKMIEYGTNH